ncbi:RHS repeat-associated core domain-containing protein [Pseudomonas serbica]|jgi:RHS repeat-associated protein
MSRSNLDTPKQQRTVLVATDQQNSVLSEIVSGRNNPMAYSAYGHQSAEHEVVSGLGFNGELREASRWYFLGNGYRVYNPRLMRFHSPDSWSPFGAGGLNAYTYCEGEPVMGSDPTGHFNPSKWWGNITNFFAGSTNRLVLKPPRRASSTVELIPISKLPQVPTEISLPLPSVPPSSPGPPLNRSLKPTNPATRNVPIDHQGPLNTYFNPVTRPLPTPPDQIEKGVDIGRDGVELVELADLSKHLKRRQQPVSLQKLSKHFRSQN